VVDSYRASDPLIEVFVKEAEALLAAN
jgi:hypothetical protein